MGLTALPPDILAARLKLVDEHIQAEIDHDIEAIMRTWCPEPWFDDVAWDERSHGRDEVRAHYTELLDAMPDFRIEEHARHVTDDFVILEVTVSGTHRRKWRDLPATNRRIESRVCVLYTFHEGGLLEFERTYYDRAIILEQLGLFHDPRKPFGKVMAVVTPPYTVIGAYLRNLFRRG